MQRRARLARWLPWAAVFLVMTLVLPATVTAQETRGRITGKVVDTSKAIIPGVTVVVTDTARGSAVTLTTNAQGLFVAPYLVPGTYKVEVELTGFKKVILPNVPVAMNETRDLSITLEVGGVQEAVSVTAEVPIVNTSDANMGYMVDQQRLASLPLIHGDPYKIMGLAPGLAHSGDQRLDRPFEPTHIIGYAFDGTRSNRSDLLIDGAPSTATANANEVIATYVPPSDLLQEFKVQTATFDAQFGNTEGGVTSMTIKSGTNRFHGTAYYFAEPSKLGANDYFGKARGQARIESSSNRPGATITGPIWKDHTFFTFGYERITDQRPRFDIAGTSWVPTQAMRNGDFSAYAGKIKIYDPLTRTGTSTYTGTQFPGNIIPTNRLNPIAQKILSYYCMPKNSGTDPLTGPAGNISDSTLPEKTQAYDNVTARVDQRISDKNRMFARFSWYERNSKYNDYLGSLASGTLFQFISWQGVIDDVHIINPTTVLNVRYGYNRFDRNADMMYPEALGFDQTKLGFPAAYNSLIPEADRRFPRLDFSGGNMVGVAYGNDFRPVTTHSFAATLTKSMGAHSVKTGVDFRQYGERSHPTGNAKSGQYGFNNSYTRQTSSSGSDYQGLQEFAAFLLGMPSTIAIQRLADYNENSKTFGFFVQDDWRVNDKLTLNLGVRYEVETPLSEINNASVSGFDYDYVQPISAAANAAYAGISDARLKAEVPSLNMKGGLKYLGVDDSQLYKTPKNTILPRLGFAYQMAPKTVVRGGVGLFAGFLGERRGDVIQTGYSYTTSLGTTTNAFGAPIPQYWDAAWVNNQVIAAPGNSQGRQTNVGQGISFFNPNPKVSKQLRWQIGVQHELMAGLGLELAYVGNYGYDIEINRNINALPEKYLNTDNSRTTAMNDNNTWLSGTVKNPFVGLMPGSGYNTSGTIARSQLLRPYPAFGDITTTNNDGKSWYNALQAGLQKRFRKGVTLGLSYTLSKWEQATEYLNATDATPTRMISDLDVTNRLSLNGIYALPFGKGQPLLADASPVVDGFVGGWQIQGVYTYQTGFPIGFGDMFYNGSPIAVSDRTVGRWFDTSVFTSILDGTTSTNATPVNHKRTLPTRFSDVRRDSINNLDLSLLKNVTIHGSNQFQFRMEFINVLNEPYFPNPVTSQTSNTFGQIIASNQSNYARRAQIGVKWLF